MKKIDLILMGLKNLWRRKLRTSLTILGVVIGTTAIIVMLSLGVGMEKAFRDEIASQGSISMITVRPPDSGGGGMIGGNMDSGSPAPAQNKKAKLNKEAVANFKKMKYVQAVSPIVNANATFIDGRKINNTEIIGMDPAAMKDFDIKLSDGRPLEAGDKNAVIIGYQDARNFRKPNSRDWREQDPIDLSKGNLKVTMDPDYGYNHSDMDPNATKPNYKTYKIKAVGITTEDDYEYSYSVIMPIDTVNEMINDKKKAERNSGGVNNNNMGGMYGPPKAKAGEYTQVKVKVDSFDNVGSVQDKIKAMGYSAFSMNDVLESMKKTSTLIQAVLGAIGGVSLLIAAIGITNTMIMSIYERTKEIGVMKVIGASIYDIRRLFLFEATMIGTIGGIIGAILSQLISFGINHLMASSSLGAEMSASKISVIPLWLMLAGVGISAAIGIISGYFPARRAMKLSALEAIQTQ